MANLEAVADWFKILEGLWVGIGKPVDEARLMLYGEELQNIPAGLLELAVKRLRRQNTWLIVPTLGAIFEAISIELHEANCMTAQDWTDLQWRKFLGAARKYPRMAAGQYADSRLVG